MDFIEGLPTSRGVDTILVVVDRLSKYAHFVGLRHPFTAVTVAMAFIKEIVRLHGTPRSIVSDRDKVFMSLFWEELFKWQGTALKRSTAYHPQTDGQTEVTNRSLETYLRCFAGDKPREWSKWLPWAEYWYNTAFNTGAKTTPFRVVYGRDPPQLLRYGTGSTKVDSVDTLLAARDAILDELKYHLIRAQQRMKIAADTKRRDVQFNVGDLVYLKLRPYRQRSLARRRNEKLSPRYYGPYHIMQRVGEVAYKLELPATSHLHPVFHVSQLRQVIGDPSTIRQLPSGLSSDLELVVQPEEVIGTRPGSTAAPDVLIKWQGLPYADATWEQFDDIQRAYPDFHLEDKVKLRAAGIDKHPVRFTYGRRPKPEGPPAHILA